MTSNIGSSSNSSAKADGFWREAKSVTDRRARVSAT
jgi:hypothetical protein